MIKSATFGKTLQTTFRLGGGAARTAANGAENLLHIGEEALTNTLEYARPPRFETRLSFSAKGVRLDLRYNGVGFKVHNGHGGFTLTGIAGTGQS